MINENIEKAKIAVNYGNLKKEKPLVVVLMGLPGSGKSYLAGHLHKKYSFTTLSGENITHAIFETEKVASGQYKEAYQVLRLIAKNLIERNTCLVIDGTNLKYEFRKQIYEELGKFAEIVLFYLVADDGISLKRANARDEKYFVLKSDDTLLERADEIITNIV